MAGTEATRLYSIESVVQVCSWACLDLVTVLGLGLLLEEERLSLPGVLDLKWWQERVRSARISSRISSRVELSPLWLPQGMSTGTLHVEEQVELHPAHGLQ